LAIFALCAFVNVVKIMSAFAVAVEIHAAPGCHDESIGEIINVKDPVRQSPPA